jgi:hypothetical protein
MPVTRIFISSTSVDLSEHRKRLMETLERLQQDGIGMESFGANPDTPVELCKREVDRADLFVLLLAHRYGWVPRLDQGGDGARSITRIEFDHALKPTSGAPKPVLAFVVNETTEWTAGREQDDLVNATSPDQAVKIYQAVQALKQFKSEVNSQFVRDAFTTPADLADKAGSAVAKWLLAQQSIVAQTTAVEHEVQELFEKVAGALRNGMYDLALTYLDSGAKTVDERNLRSIADKRLDIASEHLSLYDDRLLQAAEEVRVRGGKRQALASLLLGKTKSQRSRPLWKQGRREEAWALASEARAHFKEAAAQDELNPDVFGSLGGLLKRTAQWARELHPGEVVALEDAMLSAYETGWQRVPDAYPLLNYIEQRAALAALRSPSATQRELIGKDESALRRALQQALRTREGQLGNEQNRPWAAFDLARGRHYLHPNVPGFLEDLSIAVREARSMARVPDDRYPVTTTCDSLRALLAANVRLEGLAEGLDLLERAVASDDWFSERPQASAPYLERELQQLQATLSEFADQQLRLSAQTGDQVTSFVRASELRWSREDEERFQAELVKWKRELEPAELKIVRGLWKVFGAKALEALTGGVPVDWNAALELIRKLATR